MNDDRNGESQREPRHLGLSRRSAGTIMVVIAYVGVVSALVGAVVGWQFLGELSDANTQGLELAEESLTAADATLDVADDIVAAVDDSLSALSATITAVGDGIGATTALAGSTAELAAALPTTLDRVDNGLASIATITGTIDNTLSQLSRIPLAPDYDPDVTLSDAIGDLRGDIAPLAENVRAVSDDLSTFSASGDELQANLDDLAASVDEVQTAVGGTTDVIAQARASTDAALALAQTTLNDIGNQLTLTRLLLVIVAIAIAIGQIVPYWVGRELRDAPVVVVADASELDDIEITQVHPDPA
jgi:methyl-accepting chemotaxis protein